MWLGLIYLEVVKLVESGVNFVYLLWNVKSVMVAKSVIYLKRLNSAKKTSRTSLHWQVSRVTTSGT